METTMLTRDYLGKMEKNMETTMLSWVHVGNKYQEREIA